jgi:transcriptional regulator with XRE-family HTH domain
MTPFGRRLRELRRSGGRQLKDMAAALGVSPAYLSALEHGHRGRPGGGLVQQVSAYFNLAWDDVDELRRLAELSHPGIDPLATELANRMAESIEKLDRATLEKLLALLGER